MCGLKHEGYGGLHAGRVTPCVGVWIETLELAQQADGLESHTLRGCVD